MATQANTFDAIVVGSGPSGGWAAKELCDHGLKTLVLERGRPVEHIKDYPTANLAPWELEHRGTLPVDVTKRNPIVSRCYAFDESTEHFFVKDDEHPYIQEKPFDWIRGYQVGGRSLIWGRACQRWSDFEFTAPERFGYGIDWPIRYKDVAPWYAHVEKFIGVCGGKDGIKNLPDGEYLPPFGMNCVEKEIQKTISESYSDRFMVEGRWAHLTQPQPIHIEQGRQRCVARNLCTRGCPFGAYFSSNSSTLPWAQKTGNLTIRPHSVVHSVIYDEAKGRARGVRVIDAVTKEATEYFARIIFLNASCLNTNLILLNSKSNRFPEGLGNDNGLLGKYILFHNYRGLVSATFEGFEDKYYYGRRPAIPIIANYRNVDKQDTDYVGGFLTFLVGSRGQGDIKGLHEYVGPAYKEAMSEPGPWQVFSFMQGEVVPREENHVRLSLDKTDAWGIPLLITSVDYSENEDKMVKDYLEQTSEMLEKAGCTSITTTDTKQAPGLDIHEMGGVRMGRDPKTSLLNEWNQLHHCKNVFVTDGACMTSTGNQSPTIFYMTLSARAANYAVEEMKRRNL
ncbi:MAG: GMC family oxidoreductase [Bacteroidota bacterium]|jgi:choline dehydrogenase-like flavoprotein|nr:MAG: GMC family oxidoreductase [Bacteroidota bacterium]